MQKTNSTKCQSYDLLGLLYPSFNDFAARLVYAIVRDVLRYDSADEFSDDCGGRWLNDYIAPASDAISKPCTCAEKSTLGWRSPELALASAFNIGLAFHKVASSVVKCDPISWVKVYLLANSLRCISSFGLKSDCHLLWCDFTALIACAARYYGTSGNEHIHELWKNTVLTHRWSLKKYAKLILE